MKQIIEKAKKEFEEFCELFRGKSFSDVDAIVKEKKLSYGSAAPDTEEDMRDINYHSILATIINDNGMCRISTGVEIYDENDNRIDIVEFKL